jgi:ligand-binding SRPBCC domain-containing protein
MPQDTRLSHRIFIAAPPEIVWAVIADLEAVQAYNPTVSKASLLPGPREGVGAGRTCLTRQGEAVERIVGWEKSKAIEIELVSSPWPVKAMRWRTEISPEKRGTAVTQELSYAPSLGILGAILNALIMRRTMDKTIASVFEALKAYCEKKAEAHA